jgi:hypothetical protein
MWAENSNNDVSHNGEKRGATFSFTRPLIIYKVHSNSKQKRR